MSRTKCGKNHGWRAENRHLYSKHWCVDLYSSSVRLQHFVELVCIYHNDIIPTLLLLSKYKRTYAKFRSSSLYINCKSFEVLQKNISTVWHVFPKYINSHSGQVSCWFYWFMTDFCELLLCETKSNSGVFWNFDKSIPCRLTRKWHYHEKKMALVFFFS